MAVINSVKVHPSSKPNAAQRISSRGEGTRRRKHKLYFATGFKLFSSETAAGRTALKTWLDQVLCFVLFFITAGVRQSRPDPLSAGPPHNCYSHKYSRPSPTLMCGGVTQPSLFHVALWRIFFSFSPLHRLPGSGGGEGGVLHSWSLCTQETQGRRTGRRRGGREEGKRRGRTLLGPLWFLRVGSFYTPINVASAGTIQPPPAFFLLSLLRSVRGGGGGEGKAG